MKGLIDSTLREGSQSVGTSFNLEQKRSILRGLCKLGIEEIELGVVNLYDQELPALLRYCRRIGYKGRLALWCRCREEDIDLAAEYRPDVLSLSIPGSDLHIEKKLGRTRNWVLEQVDRCVRQAKARGISIVSLGIEDATRAELPFLKKLILQAAKAGTNRVRLADTVGVATPDDIRTLIRMTRSLFDIEIGVHCHNDFGMATANSITALDNGADWADATVYGLGERAGNARLEEIAAFAVLKRGKAYRLSELKPLAEHVVSFACRPLDPHHPVVGAKIFQCETGLHLQGLKNDPRTYEPYQPELVGARRALLYGGKIGKREIKQCLDKLGAIPERHQLEKIVRDIRTLARPFQRPLQEKEFQALIQSALGTAVL